MVIVFDLDETLFPERTYVESGFRAVARWGYRAFAWNPRQSECEMLQLLDRDGRGRVFNSWLASRGVKTARHVKTCISVYRSHVPEITLLPAAVRALSSLSNHPVYVVTDGHKLAQARKIAALGLNSVIKKAYITHRYGVANAKPSTHCFELIRKRENCDWNKLFYVGDDPSKDFVNLNRVGATTIRVLTGQHSKRIASRGFDGQYCIASLDELNTLLKELVVE